MGRKVVFLWPTSYFRARGSFRPASVTDVEFVLDQLYSGIHSVLFSSARAAISAVCVFFDTHRNEYIWCPPFSSHCVLEAISGWGTPTTQVVANTKIALVYHQWGYGHIWSGSEDVIEDSADSLLLPGLIDFPNSGRMQIVSLPKVIGSASGGVVFCKKEEDAFRLREIRDARTIPAWFQFFLRLIGRGYSTAQRYWSGVESSSGRLPSPACRDILLALEVFDDIIRDRQEKWELVRSIAPSWLKTTAGRLPCVLPVEIDKETLYQAMILGLDLEVRHFNRRQAGPQSDLVKVLPLPLHQDVTLGQIERFIECKS
jgi:putative PLP-dependent aminotransferase (TIGR04422 family)